MHFRPFVTPASLDRWAELLPPLIKEKVHVSGLYVQEVLEASGLLTQLTNLT